jgi:phosphopantetheine adenylyltransferase
MSNLENLLHKIDVIVEQTKTNLVNLNNLLASSGYGSIDFKNVLFSLDESLRPLDIIKMINSGNYKTYTSDNISLVIDIGNDNSITYHFINKVQLISRSYNCYADIDILNYKNLAKTYILESNVSLGVFNDHLVRQEFLTVQKTLDPNIETLSETMQQDTNILSNTSNSEMLSLEGDTWESDPMKDLDLLNKLTSGSSKI